MATVTDVAEAILTRKGSIDSYQLHKLVFYAQAVHLARTDRPLFGERIEAWKHGPAVPALFGRHRGAYRVDTVGGDIAALDEDARSAVEEALSIYGRHTSTWLQAQTHIDEPWRQARRGLSDDARGGRQITPKAMLDYYGPMLNDPEIDSALAEAASQTGLTGSEILARYGA